MGSFADNSRTRLFRSCLTLLLAVTAAPSRAQMASQQPVGSQQPPVSVSALPSRVLVVLGARGRLALFHTDTNETTPIKETLGFFTPVDMASAHMPDGDVIFVTMYGNYAATQAQSVQREGIVAQYSMSGRQVRAWPVLGHAFTGIAIDAGNRLVYLGNPVSGEISVLNVGQSSGNPSPRYIARAAGISRLGPLALDADGHRLFVGDVEEGRVYVLDLQKRKSRVLVSSLGEPAALAYDPETHSLFIADAARRCVWQVAGYDKSAKPAQFAPDVKLREPRGVAVDVDHIVWVADYGTGSIVKMGAAGKTAQKPSGSNRKGR